MTRKEKTKNLVFQIVHVLFVKESNNMGSVSSSYCCLRKRNTIGDERNPSIPISIGSQGKVYDGVYMKYVEDKGESITSNRERRYSIVTKVIPVYPDESISINKDRENICYFENEEDINNQDRLWRMRRPVSESEFIQEATLASLSGKMGISPRVMCWKFSKILHVDTYRTNGKNTTVKDEISGFIMPCFPVYRFGYIVFEKMDMTLREYIEEFPDTYESMLEDDIIPTIKNIALTLSQVGIKHADVHTGNIMVNIDKSNKRILEIKLIDFGEAWCESSSSAQEYASLFLDLLFDSDYTAHLILSKRKRI